MKKVKMPFFLTKEIAERALKTAHKMAVEEFPEMKRSDGHGVVLVPTLVVDDELDYPQKYSTGVAMLTEASFGQNWEHEYNEVAQCKAGQLWDGSNPGGTTKDTPSHLFFEGDTPYWGGDKMEGIVATYSGSQPYFDRMISRNTLSIMIALADHARKEYEKVNGKVDFFGQPVAID